MDDRNDGVGERAPVYTYFDDTKTDHGIPLLSKAFEDYSRVERFVCDESEIDDVDRCVALYDRYVREKLTHSTAIKRWDGRGRGRATASDMAYVHRYLKDPVFTSMSLLTSRARDHVVYGIFAYVLRWPSRDIAEFGRAFHGVGELARSIARCVDECAVVEHRGHPLIPQTFKVLHAHFRADLGLAAAPPSLGLVDHAPCFDIGRYVSREWTFHFHRVHMRLQAESWGPDDSYLRALPDVHRALGVPFAELIDGARATAPNRGDRPKYVTGVACCGKTTVLNALERHGWTVRSRTDLGTLGGRSKWPAQAAALHWALDRAYRAGAGHVIGDRGPIDHPLWTAVMELCDPRHATTLVPKLLEFYGRTFNELVVGYHGGYDVVVFLDPYPSRNRRRMLERCEGGDAFRARLPQYVPAQFMAYYMFAVLFGFKIVFVPYTPDGRLDVDAHRRNAEALAQYYGPARAPGSTDPLGRVSRMEPDVPEFMRNTDFSKLTGIYK